MKTIKKLLRRLESKKGETLVELLAAILIFTFASIILFTLVTTAARINDEARKSDEEILSQLGYAEKAEAGNARTGYVTVTVENSAERVSGIPVYIFRDYSKEDTLYSYARSGQTSEETE